MEPYVTAAELDSVTPGEAKFIVGVASRVISKSVQQKGDIDEDDLKEALVCTVAQTAADAIAGSAVPGVGALIQDGMNADKEKSANCYAGRVAGKGALFAGCIATGPFTPVCAFGANYAWNAFMDNAAKCQRRWKSQK